MLAQSQQERNEMDFIPPFLSYSTQSFVLIVIPTGTPSHGCLVWLRLALSPHKILWRAKMRSYAGKMSHNWWPRKIGYERMQRVPTASHSVRCTLSLIRAISYFVTMWKKEVWWEMTRQKGNPVFQAWYRDDSFHLAWACLRHFLSETLAGVKLRTKGIKKETVTCNPLGNLNLVSVSVREKGYGPR